MIALLIAAVWLLCGCVFTAAHVLIGSRHLKIRFADLWRKLPTTGEHSRRTVAIGLAVSVLIWPAELWALARRGWP